MAIDFGADRNVHQFPVVIASRLMQQREAHIGFQRVLGGLQHRHAMQAGDLGLRVHLRGAGRILHDLARKYRARMFVELGNPFVVRRHRFHHGKIELARE